MNSNKITISATGDSFITRRLPSHSVEWFNEIAKILDNSDVKFTNLEVTTHHTEGYPSAVSGGTWAMASPGVLQDLKEYGFNLFAWANNHTMDYSHGGLLATKKNLDANGFVHSGAGGNLHEASKPNYLETPVGRVALISATSTFHASWAAGEQRPDMIGRPGVNPLRFDTTYYVTGENLKELQDIAENTYINADHNLAVKEGFEVNQDDEFFFGAHRFKIAKRQYKETKPFSVDMERLKKSISEAKRQANTVLVSIHSHEMTGEDKAKPAQFLEIASKMCIDSGADAIIGHGPHILRGIEIYKGKPIFYSLGNFIFQNDSVSTLPADFYQKYNLSFNHNVADALDVRSANNTKGLGVNRHVWESIIAEWDVNKDNQIIGIRLYPIELGFGMERYEIGWPKLSQENNHRILERLQRLSAPYGTKIDIKDGIGTVHL